MLQDAGIKIHEQQLDQMWRYHNLLRLRNQDRDLTRLIGFRTIVERHYIDCMIIGKFHPLNSPLLDVGTGAGFPGIPLKVRYPHLRVILAEPRPKRVAFLHEAVSLLQLSRVQIFEHKVVSKNFTGPVAGVITRAVETMGKTFLRSSGATRVGSHLIFMKGPNADEELEEFTARFGSYADLIVDESYTLPNTPLRRRLIVFKVTRALEGKLFVPVWTRPLIQGGKLPDG